jgi:histidinol-phosphate aminotransferase
VKYQRKILSDVEGYVPGEQPRMPGIIKLNTNENPYPPSPRVIEALRALSTDALRKYPDPLALEFRTACAQRYGYDGPEWVVAGNGMDELLAVAVRAFVDPGDAILTTYPTYTLYETLARLHGARPVLVDLDHDFQLPDLFFETAARLCILPRPNTPSGVCPPRAEVERLCRTFDGMVIIDEAYVDFANDHCMDFPRRFENAVVMRTFSKSFSLAGMRVGTAVARPDIIDEFLKVKDSYNLNACSQAAGIAAIQDYEAMETNVHRVRAARDRLIRELRAMGFRVPASQSNFVLAQWDGAPPAEEIFKALRARAIVVRHFKARRLENALRISVGTEEQTDALLKALRAIIRR